MEKVQEHIHTASCNYRATTPLFWRKLGDALLGVHATITAAAIYNEEHWLAYTALGIGVVGKFLTDFFKEKNGQ